MLGRHGHLAVLLRHQDDAHRRRRGHLLHQPRLHHDVGAHHPRGARQRARRVGLHAAGDAGRGARRAPHLPLRQPAAAALSVRRGVELRERQRLRAGARAGVAALHQRGGRGQRRAHHRAAQHEARRTRLRGGNVVPHRVRADGAGAAADGGVGGRVARRGERRVPHAHRRAVGHRASVPLARLRARQRRHGGHRELHAGDVVVRLRRARAARASHARRRARRRHHSRGSVRRGVRAVGAQVAGRGAGRGARSGRGCDGGERRAAGPRGRGGAAVVAAAK
mmetsp:Transcript_7418/g.27231  ORF Transcript_7418/g.27231 Transcript_7418/m.27231 type:complete len:280 (-) Transcript_7418:639-1478(-)